MNNLSRLILLEDFVAQVKQVTGGHLSVERHQMVKDEGDPYAGAFMQDERGAGAGIEVWCGAGGMDVAFADALQVEWPVDDDATAFSSMWSVILGGCSVHRVGLRYYFVAGGNELLLAKRGVTRRARAHPLRTWPAWIKPLPGSRQPLPDWEPRTFAMPPYRRA